jgi:probable HAF family extracellular repeat protein
VQDLGASIKNSDTLKTASGINAGGQIVGRYDLDDGSTHAFLLASSRLADLGTLGGAGSEALGINQNGLIVGGGVVRCWLVLPAEFVAAAMASSSASVADTSGQAASDANSALANTAAPWWDANPLADSKANTYATADSDAYPDSSSNPNSPSR